MWIKVCGIRDRETARQVADLGVDAIGLNFYHRSPRSIDVDTAIEISKFLPAEIARVGVFVNHSVDEVESIALQCPLNLVQLHGDEQPSYLVELRRRLPQIRLIRAWRMGADRLNGLKTFLAECQAGECDIAGCLVDAHVTGIYGGSGKTVSWTELASDYQTNEWPRLILAGGLTPANIAQAIESTKPWGVDVASGVESSPGVKNIDLVRRFVANARISST